MFQSESLSGVNSSGFSLGGGVSNGGGILTLGYCSRIIGCFFPIVLWKFLWGQGFDGGG